MKSLVLIFLLIAGCAFAQDPKADFIKINQSYNDAQELVMQVKYELFFDDEIKASDEEHGVYKRNKESYYVKQTGNEMLITDKHMLVIDNESKTIILDNVKGRIKPLNLLKVDMDSIFHFYKKVEFYKTGKNNSLYAYNFILKQGLYTSIVVVFDPLSFFVTEIINTYREKMPDANNVPRNAKLKTSFININTKPSFKNDFNEATYIRDSQNKIELTKPYSSYKLLTNLKKL